MRTEHTGVELKSNGKYSVKFATWCGRTGAEYIANEVESAAVFATEDDAYAGSKRALDVLEETGRWPNMCAAF